LSQPMVQTFTDEQYMHGLNNKLDNLIKIQEAAKANAKAEKAALEARLKTVEKQIRELQNKKAGQRLAKVRGDVLNQTHRLGNGKTPVNGEWNDWGSWSACDNWKRVRFRKCNNPPPKYGGICHGKTFQEEPCSPGGGCYCNGMTHNGEGNCYGKSELCNNNNWCYIGNSSTCEDAKQSTDGAPYRWSCLACKKDCIGKPREDLKLLCSDGRAGDKWDGCFERSSVRVQCPRGRSPCNGLRKEANFSEFHCQRFDVKEKNCTKYGGVRDCTNEEKDFMCIEEPREDDYLLCSDGEVGTQWDGCFDRGSVRIQCPKGFHPCNDFRAETNNKEFHCGKDCKKFGGSRKCLRQDISKYTKEDKEKYMKEEIHVNNLHKHEQVLIDV